MSQDSRNPRDPNAAAATIMPGAAAAGDAPGYPGKRFGLPADGPMSAAPMGRRLLALILDWVLCYLIVSAIAGHSVFTGAGDSRYFTAEYGTLALFTAEVWVLTAISGLTVGKRLLRIRTIRTDGTVPGFKWAALRTLLLLAVVPACLSDRDLRGLHDRAADTIVVRLLAAARRPSAAWASGARALPWAPGPSASAASAAAP